MATIKYILVAKKDSLTKWIEIFALSNKEAYTVATCIADEVFYRHGAARLVITDQLIQQLMTLTRILSTILLFHTRHKTHPNNTIAQTIQFINASSKPIKILSIATCIVNQRKSRPAIETKLSRTKRKQLKRDQTIVISAINAATTSPRRQSARIREREVRLLEREALQEAKDIEDIQIAMEQAAEAKEHYLVWNSAEIIIVNLNLFEVTVIYEQLYLRSKGKKTLPPQQFIINWKNINT